MRLAFALLIGASQLIAQEAELSSLPYTPSLEPRFMDKSADPCLDFYRYSCGNWSKLNPIPPDQAAWDVYAKMADDNLRFLWGILQQASETSKPRTSNEAKIGDYFHACMDEGAVERAGLKPLGPALAQIAELKSVEGIGAYVGNQHHSGIDRGLLFGFSSDYDFDDSSREIAFAKAGGLGLPDRDYYTKTDPKSQEIRERYQAHVARMLGLLASQVRMRRATHKA